MLTLPTNQSKPCATKAGSCGSLLPKTFSAKPWSLLTPLRGNSSLPLLRPLTILLFLLELTFWNFHFPPCALMFFQHQSVHGTKTLGRKKPWELWIIQLWLTQDIPNNQGSYCWCPPGVSPCVFPRAGAGTVAVSEAVQQVTHLSLSLSLSFPSNFLEPQQCNQRLPQCRRARRWHQPAGVPAAGGRSGHRAGALPVLCHHRGGQPAQGQQARPAPAAQGGCGR